MFHGHMICCQGIVCKTVSSVKVNISAIANGSNSNTPVVCWLDACQSSADFPAGRCARLPGTSVLPHNCSVPAPCRCDMWQRQGWPSARATSAVQDSEGKPADKVCVSKMLNEILSPSQQSHIT